MKLLRWALVALVALFSTFNLQAKTFSLGITAGSSHPDYNLQGYRGAINNYTGFHVGVGATLKAAFISLSPELIYTNNRFDIDDSLVLGDGCEVRDHRLDVPVVVGINFLGPLMLEAGPVFTVYNEAKASYYNRWNYTDNLGRITPEIGYVVGLKLSIADKVVLGARYYGYSDDYQFADSGYYIRTHSYALTAGFNF